VTIDGECHRATSAEKRKIEAIWRAWIFDGGGFRLIFKP
jgi:hypothetical protein